VLVVDTIIVKVTVLFSSPSYPKDAFCLRRMACFGLPKFDRRPALHILSADSRFPDLQPGEQLAAGNHFLAVFPRQRIKSKRRRLRGGSVAGDDNDADNDDD
jgi:hypothetical protein